jgi:hypothetical protein
MDHLDWINLGTGPHLVTTFAVAHLSGPTIAWITTLPLLVGWRWLV